VVDRKVEEVVVEVMVVEVADVGYIQPPHFFTGFWGRTQPGYRTMMKSK
jgi:hypothetical protein